MDIEILKQLRKEKGFTFKQLSELSSVPLRTIEDMFAGRTKPRIDTVEAIEKALGLSMRTFDLTDDEKALIITLRRLNKGKALIKAVLTMLGEFRSTAEILDEKRA